MSSLFLVGDTMPEDLVYAADASAATGVPEQVIWQWAARKKIARFPGRTHGTKTMYSLKQVQERAATYKAAPQRRPSYDRAAA